LIDLNTATATDQQAPEVLFRQEIDAIKHAIATSPSQGQSDALRRELDTLLASGLDNPSLKVVVEGECLGNNASSVPTCKVVGAKSVDDPRDASVFQATRADFCAKVSTMVFHSPQEVKAARTRCGLQ
jgi:hypothetical protein